MVQLVSGSIVTQVRDGRKQQRVLCCFPQVCIIGVPVSVQQLEAFALTLGAHMVKHVPDILPAHTAFR